MSNTLEPFFAATITALETHQSDISRLIRQQLNLASTGSIEKSPNSLPQCEALTTAFAQASNPLLTHLETIKETLHWADSGGAELVGPSGMVVNNHVRVGLFFQNSDVNYPNHHHAAEELYLVISGEAKWSKASEPAATLKQPLNFIHHKSWEMHAMQTQSEPLLALWCWAGNIDFSQYKMDSTE